MTDQGGRADPSDPPPPAARPPSTNAFDFDEDSIGMMLDGFIEQHTGPQDRCVSHPPDPSDAGAKAAQRTVLEHKSRDADLPLVGEGLATKQRRLDLLQALADQATGSARARLLAAKGELHEELGASSEAADAYRQALQADARDVVVLRALRRIAIQEEDWHGAAQLLEREASLELTAAERGAAAKLLSHLCAVKLENPAAAEQAAAQAATLQPQDFVAWVQLAAARLRRQDESKAADAIASAASCWPEPKDQVVLLFHAAQQMERSDRPNDADKLYAKALELDPTALLARLARARIARGRADAEGAAIHLEAAAQRTADASLASALRRASALHWAQDPNGRGQAMALLQASDAAPARWTEEELRRPPAPVEAAPGENPLSDVEPEPGSLLARLIEADALGLDEPERLQSLRATYRDLSPQEQVGMALSLAELAELSESGAAAALLAEAMEADPGAPIVSRAMLMNETIDAQIRAAAWLEEAQAAGGDRGAFAAMMVARLSPSDAATRATAYAVAEEMSPDYLPALWAQEDSELPPAQRAHAAAAQAQPDDDPRSIASAQLRAALWSENETDAAMYAREALSSESPDPILVDDVIHSLGERSRAAGDMLREHAKVLDPKLALMRAAAAYQAAGAPELAARVLREASELDSDDPAIRVRRQQAELQAGEFARVADEAMQRARASSDEMQRLGSLSWMAEVDRCMRRDMQSARLSLQSLAETRPGHIPTARALEWDALQEDDPERILYDAKRLMQALPHDSVESLARRRLMLELIEADPDRAGSELDRRLLEGSSGPLQADPGLARKTLGAALAHADHDAAVRALLALQENLPSSLQRGALAIEAARILEASGEPERALQVLETAHDHPLAIEEEAHIFVAAERWEEAAQRYEEAAGRAQDGTRAASLWRAAACIYEEKLRNGTRAIEAYARAAERDIAYFDVYRRLATLYRADGRLDEWEALTAARLQAGPDLPTQVLLWLEHARVRRQRGDLQGSIQSLQACLQHDPGHADALTELAEAYRGLGEWQRSAETLIRMLRLKRSPQERLQAFSRLAQIYEQHLNDLPRAEASLRQMLKIEPEGIETLDRLAAVLLRIGKASEAANLLEDLLSRGIEEPQNRDYRIRLALAYETMGQARVGEAALEALRETRPTDPVVIATLADYYARQSAGPAAAMHLNRAATDLRAAIEETPQQAELWETLLGVLERRLGRDGASCAASAALAAGHQSPLFATYTREDGSAFGTPETAMAGSVHETLAPRAFPRSARRLLALAGIGFDKAMPFDSGAWRPRRLDAPMKPLLDEAQRCADRLGISEFRLLATDLGTLTCIPISSDPPTILISRSLAEATEPAEREFLFARALAVAAIGLAPWVRARPKEREAALIALLQGHVASRAGPPLPRPVQELRKKLVRAVPRRQREELDDLIIDVRADTDFDLSTVGFSLAQLGNRIALTLTGHPGSAINALLKIAGTHLPSADPNRLQAIRQCPEAWSLLHFAIQDTHFEARREAGVIR